MATVQELIDVLSALTDEEKLLPVVIFDSDMNFNSKIKISISHGTDPSGDEGEDEIDVNDPEVTLSGGERKDPPGISVKREN